MSTSALGFLYQTRTILRSSPVNPSPYFCRSLSSSATRQLRRRPGRPHTLERDVQADVAPGYDPNSTLTPVESQKFRAIFEAAAQGLPPPSLQKPSDKSAQAGEEKAYEFGKSLDTTFEQLLADNDQGEPSLPTTRSTGAKSLKQKTMSSTVLRDLSPEFPAALQGAWRDVRRAMIVDTKQSNDTNIENEVFQNHVFRATEDAVHKQRSEDIAKIRKLLSKADTDVAVWNVLDNHVFPRIVKLVRIVRARLQKSNKSKSTSKGTGISSTQEQKSETVATIIQSTYSVHLLNAMRTLRTRFPRSLYALAIVPSVKKLDPVSQILGLTTELYNELLYILWRQHSNIFDCARVVEDMDAQGLVGDRATAAVFLDARREMLAALEEIGNLSAIRSAWWQLSSVQDAAKRWSTAMDALDVRADEERRIREQWDMEQAGEYGRDLSDSYTNDSESREILYNDQEPIAQSTNAPLG